MAEVKPSTSLGEDAVEIVVEASCSGEAGSTSPRSVPPTIAAESPSFLTWMWIQILTVCSGVWGVVRGGLSGCRMSGLASGAQQTQKNSESEVSNRIAASKSTWSEVPGRDFHHSVSAPCSDMPSVWEELKASAPRFFRDDWVQDSELGPLIAEGGQPQIFEAKYNHDLVLKVFKFDVGFSLADLKCHWPHSVRKDGEDCSEFRSMQERSSRFLFEDFASNFDGDRCMISADYECAMFVQGTGFWRAPEVLQELQTKVEDRNDLQI